MKSSKTGNYIIGKFGTRKTYPFNESFKQNFEESFSRKSFKIMFANNCSAEECRYGEMIDELIDKYIAEDCLTEFWNGLWSSYQYMVKNYVINEKIAFNELKSQLDAVKEELKQLQKKFELVSNILED